MKSSSRRSSFIKKLPLILLIFFSSLLFVACTLSDCPADGNGNPVCKLCSTVEAQGELVEGLFRGTELSSEFFDQSSCALSADPEESNGESVEQKVEVASDIMAQGSEKGDSKSDRLVHDVLLGFDEFKTKVINSKGKSVIELAGNNTHRFEPDGKEYNYASAAKGAKILNFNKEARGASNILGKDMDRYLRNPCSAEEKFVIIELSEETLVVTIELANFEHYSSNFKDFQLLGSLVYPTDTWVMLGNFTARNVKQSQRFTLHEPKWVRYLRLNFLSHYGSEFYCTLSVVQVYGVDAVERMLEDLISDDGQKNDSSQAARSQTNDSYHSLVEEGDLESVPEDSEPKTENPNSHTNDQVGDLKPQPIGRMPGDSVLKILMQKVRALDVNLSVLERYLEELNSRYGNIVKDLEKEIAEKHMLLEKIRLNVADLVNRNEAIEKDVSDIFSWKSVVSLQMNNLMRENQLLRLHVEKALQNQVHMENKSIVVFLVTSMCCFLATIKLFVDMVLSVCRRNQEFRRFCKDSFSWMFFLFSFNIMAAVLLL